MTVFQKRSTALVLTIVVVALSLCFGVWRSAEQQRKQIEAGFVNGFDQSGSDDSLQSYLNGRISVASNLLKVAARSSLQNSAYTNDVQQARDALSDARTPSEKYVANQELERSCQALIQALKNTSLSAADLSYVEGFLSELQSYQDLIERDPYNAQVDRFNQETLSAFPVCLFRYILPIHTAEKFAE